jgi:hypothetical protein
VVTEGYKHSNIWHAFLLVARGAAEWDRVCDKSPKVWTEQYERKHKTDLEMALYVAA